MINYQIPKRKTFSKNKKFISLKNNMLLFCFGKLQKLFQKILAHIRKLFYFCRCLRWFPYGRQPIRLESKGNPVKIRNYPRSCKFHYGRCLKPLVKSCDWEGAAVWNKSEDLPRSTIYKAFGKKSSKNNSQHHWFVYLCPLPFPLPYVNMQIINKYII